MSNAIGMVEFTSIARGIYAVDQMVKTSEVEIVTASSVCPGKYIAIVQGDVAAVQDSVSVGERLAEEFLVDSIIIPNVTPDIFRAITGTTMPDKIKALGIMESFSLSTMIIAADAILKAADLQPLELRLGSGLGGKSFFTFTGDVAAVKAGIEAGKTIAQEKGLLVNLEVIPSPSNVLVASLL
ncbi:Carboxysome shell and ethanolamine utilization microcompartment protein CcmL/EutN [Caloramator quimbayensis]|uniref:Carboxysome shell and ethanolamine utilization microcompartment protein CcmL/EutN n=1 Tax=Caloramator quimbayensis TaxID=1147123 RepID=A0A1T4WG82_9CLOT|nr:BMC domain-containing protein [Caloramator quimbayensis]SKA75968.1 Carboxysome shell and ethanolamine utilization microcompartment protein CcmL/EutN [Caloramator quimbayensis]